MIPVKFDYLAPTSVEEALAALGEHGDEAKILAGGQSLLPVLRMRLNAPEVVIDLGGITSLRGIRDDGDAIVIGAMTTHPLGTKGVGEAGTIASTPAVINAIVDAVRHLGVGDVPMPATPPRRARPTPSAPRA